MIIVFLIVLLLVSVFWKINQNEYACPAIKCIPDKIVYDTSEHEYKSLCDFKLAKCRNPKLELASVPAPGKCNSACPANYMPVYDTAGKQYANSCQFEIAKCINPKLELAPVRY
jgi:hypothetical protein